MMRSARSVVSENLYSRFGAGAMVNYGNGTLHREYPRVATRTITSLKRWSITNRELPGETQSLSF